jgi:cell fate regulator YaaT (PSP1 superfamily)
MDDLEYLAGYGRSGDFGRFRAAVPLPCSRGERVVVRSHRGLEIAQILRPSAPGHAHFLPNTTVGQLLRNASAADLETELEMARRALSFLDRARVLADELSLPLEILDAEILLDGAHAIVYYLRFTDCDVRPFVSALSREFTIHVLLTDLSAPASPPDEHSCGKDGGCGSCSSGGCGSCSTKTKEHFAVLREKMEQRRTPLL